MEQDKCYLTDTGLTKKIIISFVSKKEQCNKINKKTQRLKTKMDSRSLGVANSETTRWSSMNRQQKRGSLST